ncbi:MAG TPA: hypothetical protein VKG25_17390 [Bryobacteraceae bacterium]|nr:hypothetical protein [Bryobacteraceae bacterium]
MKKVMTIAALLGMSLAYAGSNYNVTLYGPTNVNGSQFQAGDLKVQLQGDKVILKQGKTSVQAPVHVETKPNKFVATSVDTNDGVLREIRIGGTSTILVFGPSDKASTEGSK